MKKNFISLFASAILVLGMSLSASAQTPLTEGGGPVIDNCSSQLSSHNLLRNDEKSATFYLHTYSPNPKLRHQDIVTYNKSTGTAFLEMVDVPANYRHLYSRAIGDQYVGYYYSYNAGKRTFDYSIGTMPQKKSADGVKQVKFEERISIDLTGRGEILKYFAVSPDESKFAVTFIVPNERNQAPYFYCFIYDNTGKELWYDKFLPSINGTRFSIQDLQLSDKGELLVLVYASKGKNNAEQAPTMQLFNCTRGNITSISEQLDFGCINSMKMLRLKNKDLFIGGYYNAKAQSATTGYFNYIVGTDPMKVKDKMHAEFTYRNDVYYEGLTDKDYYVKCDYLYEQSDKIVVMLGEQYASIQQHSDKSALAYKHHTGDIMFNKFTLGGTDLGYLKVNKHQTAQSGGIVTTHDEGERIGCYLFDAKRPLEKNPTFESLNITYFPIFKDNQIFVMYGDKFSNYAETATEWEAADMEKGEDDCVVITKLDYSIDKKVVMLPNKNAQVFNNLWLIDGENVYFGVSGKKAYSVEKFRLNQKWSWDK